MKDRIDGVSLRDKGKTLVVWIYSAAEDRKYPYGMDLTDQDVISIFKLHGVLLPDEERRGDAKPKRV